MAEFSLARKAMVDNQIATSSVTEPRLLSVLGRVPRELFVPADRRALAYSDAHHPLGNGRFLAPPAVFAKLVQLAEISDTYRVLDYWPGTGYSTAVLAGLARKVVAVEPDAGLAAATRGNLASLGISNATVAQDLHAFGAGTFDAILVEGAIGKVSEALLDLLAMGGRLVCLLRQGPVGIATVQTKTAEGVATRTWFNATLPLVDLQPEPEIFVF